VFVAGTVFHSFFIVGRVCCKVSDVCMTRKGNGLVLQPEGLCHLLIKMWAFFFGNVGGGFILVNPSIKR
jgi:hypothetical protein